MSNTLVATFKQDVGNYRSLRGDDEGRLEVIVTNDPSTATNQELELVLVGNLDETAPVSDTASSGLNGRLQRIAQRLSTIISLIPAALTSLGNFKVSIQEFTGYSYLNIAGNATTVVKSGTGVLRKIVVNKTGATSTITVYDNTAGSGTKIATIATSSGEAPFDYNCNFSTGLTVVTAGIVAADITVIYT